jgi:phthalate 4,5-dioxygenase oxygenase subunit
MITREENERLTRVEGDAPMGRLMREHYWIPFAISNQLVAGDAPLQVRLLGQNYVAFRAEDGRVGFFDELCPHRRASLALGRVEGNGIRCIFHGWKMDVSGKVVEAPTQLVRAEEFTERVRVEHFPVHEAGGLAWVFLGKAQAPGLPAQAQGASTQAPRFPELPFVGDIERNTWLSVSLAQCNWLQGVEGTLDSAHVGTLHQSWIREIAKLPVAANIGLTLDGPPRYDTQFVPYGLRAAALRQTQDGRTYVRVTEYCMPFVGLVAMGTSTPRDGYMFIAVPVDDTHHLLFYGYYSEHPVKLPGEVGIIGPGVVPDLGNFAPLPGGRAKRWGQDRAIMKQGHFTGFARSLLEEDMVVQASMGPIVDRSKEHISSSDVAVVQTRRLLLTSLEDFEAGRLPPGSALAAETVRVTNPLDAVIDAGMHWEDFSFDKAAA